jgi:curved DNA-binding protein CbpA
MTDCFALLRLPRRAHLDAAELQAAWHAQSRAAHPDTPGGDARLAAEINAAHETLSSPEKRLKHLLELEGVPWRPIPISAELMQLFTQLGAQLQRATGLTQKKQQASSALAKALLAPAEMQMREDLEALGTRIHEQREQLLTHLPEQDWPQLQSIQATLAYLGKWQNQVREALLLLNMA